MESGLFRFILRHSLRQQIILLVMTVASFPVLYGTLELPKRIINDAIQGDGSAIRAGGIALTQVEYLFALSGLFLALVLVNGGFKFVINTYKGRLGERMLRRLRYELYVRILRFPPQRFRKVSSGELIPMITAEVESLGGFIGDAVAIPAFQGGTLLVYLAFIFVQDPVLGLAAVALYPFQGWLIPRLQRRVNQLGKARVRAVRGLADRVGETMAGIRELHTHDAASWHRADIAHRLGDIYDIRMEIYQRKFFIKFLNNFINQLTPFFFYSIGGYLVIRNQLSFGALVAVLAAYKDLASPWKELLDWYQQKEDARIKYEQVVEQFDVPELVDGALIDENAGDDLGPITGALTFAGVTLDFGGNEPALDQVGCTLPLDRHVGVVGSGRGRSEFALLAARLALPTSGVVRLGPHDMATLPEAVTGRRLAHVGSAPHIFAGTLWDNLIYGLRHRPRESGDADAETIEARRRRAVEAARAGNTAMDFTASWLPLPPAGVGAAAGGKTTAGDRTECARAQFAQNTLLPLIKAVELDRDLYTFGLSRTVDPNRRPDIAGRVMAARESMAERLAESGMSALVERFDPDRFNFNASVAENLLFGTPVGPAFQPENLTRNGYVLDLIHRLGLAEGMMNAGHKAAATMVEMFADLEPGHEFFQRYSFVTLAELPGLREIVEKVDKDGVGSLDGEERSTLMAVPFNLIPNRHRLGLMTEDVAQRMVNARHRFARDLPAEYAGAVEFFDRRRYNGASSIRDNILFGKPVFGQRHAQAKVDNLLGELADRHGLRDLIVEVGLDEPVGVAGGRLTAAQRQKTALVRALVKNPDVLVLDEATNAIDPAGQARIHEALRGLRRGRGLIWVAHRVALARDLDHVVVIEDGRVVDEGPPTDLDHPDRPFRRLLELE